MVIRKFRVAFAAIALSLAPLSALSQPYPTKPVRLMVGFAPGGVVDVPARIVAAKLGEIWGTPVVVENRTGAGGSIAADVVAKAPADGYTLLICATPHAVNPSFYKKLPYDPIKDFAAISMIGSTPNVLLVHPSAQTTTVGAFIAYAKANPGKVSIGSAGVGTSQHLSMELLKSMTSTDIVHVPYKGGASALADLLGGQLPAIVSGLTTAVTSIKAGKVRALGVTSAKRSPQMPELATIAESGVPGFEVSAWTGLCAPAALPKPLVAKLNADMVKVLSMPDTQRRLVEQGVDVAPTTPEEFSEFLKSEIVKWAKVVKEAGITPE
jgi:tripartite-type tricarboxylate transporter receptor subunit TctC